MSKKPVIPGKLQSFAIRVLAFLMAGEGLIQIVQLGLPFAFQKLYWNSATGLQLGLAALMLLAGLFVLKGWSWGLPILAVAYGYRLYFVSLGFWQVRGDIVDLSGPLILLSVVALLLGATLLCLLSWHLGRVFWQRSGRLWWWAFFLFVALLALGTSLQFDEQGPHPAPGLTAAETRTALKPLAKSGASFKLLQAGHSKLGTFQWQQSPTRHGLLQADAKGFSIDDFSGFKDFNVRYDACRGLLSIQGRDFYPRAFSSESMLFTKGPSEGLLFERGSGAVHGQFILAREKKSERWYLVLSEFFWYGMEIKALGYRIDWPESGLRNKKAPDKTWTGCEKTHFKTRNKK